MNADEFATYVGASPQRVRTWCRSGRLPGVRRDVRGRWVIDDPKAAAAAWRKHADHSKSSLPVIERAVAAGRAVAEKRLPAPAPPIDRVVYESERGRLEISGETFRALERADANPDLPLLTPALVNTLDEIMRIVGEGAAQ